MRVYEEDGMLEKGSVEFTNFVLGGRWFAAMASGVFHDFTFSLGVSLILSVPVQTLIDHHRAELSAYPEAERCGWRKDRWGVSWQILPDNLGSLLQDEGFRSAFMSMGKIQIDTRTE
ncbi:VOC family protein [Corynebacterium sp. SCR221107]|nr:VOC family protein [Corynebacterium sp. SCR221107]WBT10030.1 VOC family protein [Corynebacterium sp. SCR221107]